MGSLLTEKQSYFKIVLQGFMYWPFKVDGTSFQVF